MVAFPNCKINIGLQITGKREDGYHDLQTVFYPVAIKDAIEIIDSPDSFSFSISGNPVEGNIGNNLCIKAYDLLKKDLPALPDVAIQLLKNIPAGAGLGGVLSGVTRRNPRAGSEGIPRPRRPLPTRPQPPGAVAGRGADGQAAHAETSTTSSAIGSGTGSSCFRRLAG